MVYVPIIGAIFLALGNIHERCILKKRKVHLESYALLAFLPVIIFMLPFAYFFWDAKQEALSWYSIGLLALVILFSTIANLLTFYSEKGSKLGSLEPAKVSEDIFVILLALIFSYIFGEGIYERNFKIIIPAIIAGLALIIPHIKKNHVSFNKYFTAAIFGSFFFALELILSKPLLNFYSPLSFYLVRCTGIFILSLILLRKRFVKIEDKKILWMIFLTGFIWIIYRIAIYYGYLMYGITSTTLVVMLAPVFVYFFAHFFLKEKLSWRNVVATAVIVGCILYAMFW